MTSPISERFWSKIIYQENGCWLWNGALTNGYGHLGVGPHSRKNALAHRLSYQMFTGVIPHGMHIDHLCRVRHCVNPNHLEAVTCRENILRGVSPPAKQALQTHCLRGHPLSGNNLYTQGRHRSCLECRTARNRSRHRSIIGLI